MGFLCIIVSTMTKYYYSSPVAFIDLEKKVVALCIYDNQYIEFLERFESIGYKVLLTIKTS